MTAPGWIVVRDPEGRCNVVSGLRPGPVVGAHGDLHGWSHVPGARWQTFEAACLSAAMYNGKVSTANMGPHSAAERGAE